MSLLMGVWDGVTQACTMRPEIAASLAIGGAGALAIEHLFRKLRSTTDWSAIITALEECMLKLQNILKIVVDRLLRDHPDKDVRDEHLQNLSHMCPTEDMNERWDTIYNMVLEVKNRHTFVLTLSYKDRKGHMVDLRASIEDAKVQCDRLDDDITRYSRTYFKSITEGKQGPVLKRMARDKARSAPIAPVG